MRPPARRSTVPPGETREVAIHAAAAPAPTTTGRRRWERRCRFARWGARSSSIRAAVALAPDRVFVITEWSSLTPQQLRAVLTADDSGAAFAKLQPGVTFMINGLSWPATERLTYQLGESVHWRVINLSSQAHPMHLHGFYFEVDSLGDGVRDVPVDAQTRHPVVTELLRSGATMTLTWTAGAGRQLAVPLPHHAPRLARAASRRGRALRERTRCSPRCASRRPRRRRGHGRDDSGRDGGAVRGHGPGPSASTIAAPRKLTLVMTSDRDGRASRPSASR